MRKTWLPGKKQVWAILSSRSYKLLCVDGAQVWSYRPVRDGARHTHMETPPQSCAGDHSKVCEQGSDLSFTSAKVWCLYHYGEPTLPSTIINTSHTLSCTLGCIILILLLRNWVPTSSALAQRHTSGSCRAGALTWVPWAWSLVHTTALVLHCQQAARLTPCLQASKAASYCSWCW